jgi:hypothetical protein
MPPAVPFADQDRSIGEIDDAQMLFMECHPGARISVLSGGLWLTEPGRPVPRFLRPQQEVTLVQRGTVVLEGVGRSTLEIKQPWHRRERGPNGLYGLYEHDAKLRRSSKRLLAQGLVLALALVIGVGLPDMLARGFHKAGDAASLAAAGAVRHSTVQL